MSVIWETYKQEDMKMEDYKITLNISPDVLREMRTLVMLQRMADKSHDMGEALMSKILDAIESESSEVDIKFKRKRS